MKLGELASALGATLAGGASERVIDGALALDAAGPGQISFFTHPRYRETLLASQAGAVLLTEESAAQLGDPPEGAGWLIHPNPYAAYAHALSLFHPPRRYAPGVRPGAVVEDGASVHPEAAVLPLAYVAPGATIGAGAVLHPHSYVGEGAEVGADSVLHPGAVVREGCILGRRVVLHAGVVIGADGFGYALDRGPEGPFHRKIPQIGRVRVEDDVEIGANSCVDRATTGETLIGAGAKLDNLVQIGHNVEVGPLSILCGQAGVAGSTKLGPGVVMGGQSAVSGHLKVGAQAQLAGASVAIGDIPEGEVWAGFPAQPRVKWLRAMAALRALPETLRALRRGGGEGERS